MRKPYRNRLRQQKQPSALYARVWRIVDGAVRDALYTHQDYLTDKGRSRRTAEASVVKRVVGEMTSFVERELAIAACEQRKAEAASPTPVRLEQDGLLKEPILTPC